MPLSFISSAAGSAGAVLDAALAGAASDGRDFFRRHRWVGSLSHWSGDRLRHTAGLSSLLWALRGPIHRAEANQAIALGFDRGEVTHHRVEPPELTADLGQQTRRQEPAVTGLHLIQALAVLRPQWVEVKDALTGEQALDPVGVPDPLRHQRLTLAAQTAAILFLWARRPNHRADPALAARPGHQRAQQSFRIDRVGLAAPLAPIHRERCGIHDVTFHAVVDQQAMHPEAVQTGFLDHNHPHRPAQPPLRRLSQLPEQRQQSRSVTRRHHPLRDPLLAGRTGRNQPGLAAEFQRHEHSAILRPGGGRNRMGEIGAGQPP